MEAQYQQFVEQERNRLRAINSTLDANRNTIRKKPNRQSQDESPPLHTTYAKTNTPDGVKPPDNQKIQPPVIQMLPLPESRTVSVLITTMPTTPPKPAESAQPTQKASKPGKPGKPSKPGKPGKPAKSTSPSTHAPIPPPPRTLPAPLSAATPVFSSVSATSSAPAVPTPIAQTFIESPDKKIYNIVMINGERFNNQKVIEIGSNYITLDWNGTERKISRNAIHSLS